MHNAYYAYYTQLYTYPHHPFACNSFHKALFVLIHVCLVHIVTVLTFFFLCACTWQIADVYTMLMLGGMTYFAQPDALKV